MGAPGKIVGIIPAFNEAATIAGIAGEVQQYVDKLIVVDDGSVDGTREILAAEGIYHICNSVNLGKGPSLLRGFEEAMRFAPDGILTLDADGQHKPREIPRLLEAIKKYPDTIIIGRRRKKNSGAPWLRRFANRFADFWVSWAAGYPVRDSQSGFRVYPASLIRDLRMPVQTGRGFVFESEILIVAAAHGVYSRGIAIEAVYLPDGRDSHYKPLRDTMFITRMIAGKLLARGMYPLGLLRSLGLLADPRTSSSR
jgi:glycosyltransferase involved in cell wall biosynthesis